MGRFNFYINFIFAQLVLITLGFSEEKQETPRWENELNTTLSLAQGSFSNWAKGGENSITWRSDVIGKFVKEEKKYSWSTSGKLSFGKTKISDNGFRKSSDELRLETVFALKEEVHVISYMAFNMRTQFAPGYKYIDKENRVQTSDFMDPGYFKQSIGFGYSPFKELKARMGFAVKETITENFPKPFADDLKTTRVEKIKIEQGLDTTIDFDQKINSSFRYTSKIILFSTLERFNEIDLNWDNLFLAKLTTFIQVNLSIKLVYDKDFSSKRQLMQSLAAGVVFDLI